MNHPIIPEGWNSNLPALAEKTANMRYDALADFLKFTAEEFENQSKNDKAKGRSKLSKEMECAAENLKNAEKNVRTAWHISEPYME